MSDVPLSVSLDPQSVSSIADAIAEAFKKGGVLGGQQLIASLDRLSDGLNANMKKSGMTAGKSFADAWKKSFENAMPAIYDAFDRTSAGMEKALNKNIADIGSAAMHTMKTVMSRAETLMSPKMLKAMEGMNPQAFRGLKMGMDSSRSGMWAATEQSMVSLKAAAKQLTAETIAEGQLRLTAEKNAGKLLAIQARAEADQATAAARLGGERRLAITKGIIKGLLMLERGIGKAIAGTAKAVTSVLGAAARGATSMVGKITSGIGRLFKRSNDDINDGLKGAFSKRNSMYQSSFNEQESIVRRSINKQKDELDKLSTQTSKGVLGAITGRGAGMGLAGLAGGLGVGAWLKQGYDQAVNYNEQLNKTNVLFGELNYGVVGFASESVKAFGATRAEAMTAIGTFGNLFRAMEINEGQAGMMAAGLTQLAGDLSSFNNVPIEEAFDAIRSGLVGESEPLRRFGVQLSETALKTQAFTMGLIEADKKGKLPNLTGQQKALAAFNLIYEQTRPAQGDFARTSREGANAVRVMTKSLMELGATIMANFLPVVNLVVNGVTDMVTKITSFVKEGSPLLGTIKTALMGVAGALALIIAFKGAVEVFQLLGGALSVIMSPIGLVVAAVVAAGAAIALLSKNSEAFRKTFSGVAKYAVYWAKKIWDAIKGAWDTITSAFSSTKEAVTGTADAIERKIKPATNAFKAIGEAIKTGIFKVASFLIDTVIPKLASVVVFIGKNAMPVIRTAIEAVGKAVAWAWDKISNIGNSVSELFKEIRPLIEPLIKGFDSLAEAIGNAFNGDASGLAGGFSDLLSGLGASASNIIGAIGSKLAPVAKRISEWFMSLFTPDKIKGYIMGVLDFIEQIGFVVGKIATHPMFIKAIAGIIAAAVVIGYELIHGIIRGIIDNLPELGKMLADAFKKLFALVWDNLGITALIGGLLATLGPGLIVAFRKMGDMSGGSLMDGIKSKASQAKGFMSSLLAGNANTKTPVVNNSITAQTSVFGNTGKQVQALQNQLRMLGSTMTVAMSPSSIKAAEEEVARLSDGLSDAQLAGLRFRDTLSNVKDGFIVVGRGARDAFKAVGDGFAAGKSHVQTQRALNGVTKTYFSSLQDGFRGAVDGAKILYGEMFKTPPSTVAKNYFAALKKGFSDVRDGAKILFNEMRNVPTGGFKTASSGIKSSMGNAFDTIRLKSMYATDAVKGAFETARLKGMYAADKIQGAWSKSMGALKSAVETGALKAMYAADKIVGSRAVKTGLSIASGVANGVSTAASGVKAAFGNMMAGLRLQAEQLGMSTGKLLGMKLAGGLMASMAGFMAGKSAGEAGGGMGGVGLSALMTGLTTGIALGPAAGVAAGAFTLLGGAIGSAGAEARAFQERVGQVADGLKNEVNQAIEDGVIKLKDLTDGLIDLSDIASSKTLQTTFVKELGDDGVKALNDLGISYDKNILPIIESSSGQSLEEFRQTFIDTFRDSATSSKKFLDGFKGSPEALKAVVGRLKEVMAKGGLASDWQAFQSKDLKLDLKGDQIVAANKDIIEQILLSQGDVDRAANVAYTAMQKVTNESMFLASTKPEETGIKLTNAYAGGADEMARLAHQTRVMAESETAVAARAKEVQDTITGLTSAADIGYESIKQLFNFGAETTIQEAVDNAVISVDGLGLKIQESLALGTTVGSAQARKDLASIGDEFGLVLQTGIKDGVVLNQDDAFNFTKDIYEAAVAGLPKDSEAYAIITQKYMEAIANVDPAIATAKAGEAAKKLAEDIKAYIAEHPDATMTEITAAITPPPATQTQGIYNETAREASSGFQTGLDTERTDIAANILKNIGPHTEDTKQTYTTAAVDASSAYKESLDKEHLAIKATILKATAAPASEIKEDFKNAGHDADAGLVLGMEEHKWKVEEAARGIARAAEEAARKELESKSPSQVFRRIGDDITKGLVKGIKAGEDDVAGAAKEIVDKAVQAAVDAANRGKTILDAAQAELFGSFFGTNAVLNPQGGQLAVTNAQAAQTTSWQNFLSSQASAAQAIWDATATPAKDRNPMQQNLVGEDPQSLNPNDVTGAQNISAVQAALQTIIDLGQAMIANGSPVNTVVSTMVNSVKKFVKDAVAMGFSRTSLEKIVDQMGLSQKDIYKWAVAASHVVAPPTPTSTTPPAKPTTPAQTRLPTPPPLPQPLTNQRMATTTNSALGMPQPSDNQSPQPPDRVPALTRMGNTNNVTVNLSLPYGDPHAIAMAVSNRIARRV